MSQSTRLIGAAAWLLLAPLAAGAVPPDLGLKPMHGPLAIGVPVPNAGLWATDCGKCHATIFSEWRSSLHGQAWSDPLFQRAFAREPYPICRQCHAPTATSNRDAAGLADAVGCATCHVRDGTVLAGPVPPVDRGLAPHPITRTALLAQAEACGPCHEFPFLAEPLEPGRPRFPSASPQQATLSEWRQSLAGRQQRACSSCHLPLVGQGADRHTDHRFLGHTPALLRQAVTVQVDHRVEGNRLHLRAILTPLDAGHATPTGELYRRLELCLDGPDGRPVALVPFGRTWRPVTRADPRGKHRTREVLADTRVPPPGQGQREGQANVSARPGTWRWRLDYVRAEGPTPLRQGARTDPLGCRQGERTRLSEGQVRVP